MKRQVEEVERNILDNFMHIHMVEGKFAKALSARHASKERVCSIYAEGFGNILNGWFENKSETTLSDSESVCRVLATMVTLCEKEPFLFESLGLDEKLLENLLFLAHLWQISKTSVEDKKSKKEGSNTLSHDAFDNLIFIVHGLCELRTTLRVFCTIISDRSEIQEYLFSLCKSIETEACYATQELSLEIVCKLYAQFLKSRPNIAMEMLKHLHVELSEKLSDKKVGVKVVFNNMRLYLVDVNLTNPNLKCFKLVEAFVIDKSNPVPLERQLYIDYLDVGKTAITFNVTENGLCSINYIDIDRCSVCGTGKSCQMGLRKFPTKFSQCFPNYGNDVVDAPAFFKFTFSTDLECDSFDQLIYARVEESGCSKGSFASTSTPGKPFGKLLLESRAPTSVPVAFPIAPISEAHDGNDNISEYSSTVHSSTYRKGVAGSSKKKKGAMTSGYKKQNSTESRTEVERSRKENDENDYFVEDVIATKQKVKLPLDRKNVNLTPKPLPAVDAKDEVVNLRPPRLRSHDPKSSHTSTESQIVSKPKASDERKSYKQNPEPLRPRPTNSSLYPENSDKKPSSEGKEKQSVNFLREKAVETHSEIKKLFYSSPIDSFESQRSVDSTSTSSVTAPVVPETDSKSRFVKKKVETKVLDEIDNEPLSDDDQDSESVLELLIVQLMKLEEQRRDRKRYKTAMVIVETANDQICEYLDGWEGVVEASCQQMEINEQFRDLASSITELSSDTNAFERKVEDAYSAAQEGLSDIDAIIPKLKALFSQTTKDLKELDQAFECSLQSLRRKWKIHVEENISLSYSGPPTKKQSKHTREL